MIRVLIVDDDSELRSSVAAALKGKYELAEAEDGFEAVEFVQKKGADLVILDMDMPRMGGMEALKKIKEIEPKTIVLILTAYSSVSNAVAAIREGAFNYLSKPIRHEEMRELVERAIRAHEMVHELAYSAPILKEEDSEDTALTTKSNRMHKVFGLVDKLARVDTAVLLRGESGTGKEVVASAIHHNSLRKDGKFVAVNLSAVPENLIESELFGHEKGAFTGADQRKIGKFQYASGGTLFLDEIGDISGSMQVKLLRVLQEKKFTPVGSNHEIDANVRIIAATNRDLEAMMSSGAFREDLFYRLSVLPIFLPPLRDRKEDIEMLVRHFIKKFNTAHSKSIVGIDAQAVQTLQTYSWPGNIRELENVIEHSFVLEPGSVIANDSLPEHIHTELPQPTQAKVPLENDTLIKAPEAPDLEDETELDFKAFKKKSEKEFILRALRKYKGKINQTSLNTNIPKKTLLRKIEKYQIDTDQFRD